MDTRQKLETTLREAMRSRDELRLRTVRMIMSAVKLTEVERGTALDESGLQSILQKELKSRRESLAEAEKAGRTDLISAAQAEIEFIETFLPAQLSTAELTALAQAAIAAAGASSPADMGKVMKVLLPQVQGRARGDEVSQLVRRLLGAS